MNDRMTALIYCLFSIRHLVVVKPKMVPDLVHHRIAHFLHDFLFDAPHLSSRPRLGPHSVKTARAMDHPEDLNGALSEPIDHSIAFHEQLPHLRIGGFRYQPPAFGKCNESVHRQNEPLS